MEFCCSIAYRTGLLIPCDGAQMGKSALSRECFPSFWNPKKSNRQCFCYSTLCHDPLSITVIRLYDLRSVAMDTGVAVD